MDTLCSNIIPFSNPPPLSRNRLIRLIRVAHCTSCTSIDGVLFSDPFFSKALQQIYETIYREPFDPQYFFVNRTDNRLIHCMDLLGADRCGATREHGIVLDITYFPVELKNCMHIRFENGAEKVCIDMEKCYRGLLEDLVNGRAVQEVKGSYNRCEYIAACCAADPLFLNSAVFYSV